MLRQRRRRMQLKHGNRVSWLPQEKPVKVILFLTIVGELQLFPQLLNEKTMVMIVTKKIIYFRF